MTIGPVGSASPGSSAAASRANGGCDIYHLWTTIPWEVTYHFYFGDVVVSGYNVSGTTFYVCGLGGMGGGPGPGGMDPGINPGTGGPGGTTNPPKPEKVAPNASKILDLSKLTPEQQEKVEEMTDSLMKDCMGGLMYGELIRDLNKKISTDINMYSNDSSIEGANMTLGLKDSGSEALFHELYHVYRHYEEGGSHDSELNSEIEAWCAMYMYLSRQEGFESSFWAKQFNIPGSIGEAARKLAGC